jgi:hypothetical protein
MQKQPQYSTPTLILIILIVSLSPQLAWTASSVSDRAIAQSQFKIRRNPNNAAATTNWETPMSKIPKAAITVTSIAE